MGSCRSILFDAPRSVMIREGATPVVGPGKVHVRTSVSLVSPGTELAFYEGVHHKLRSGVSSYPCSAGYSNVGVVQGVGEGVSALRTGDRVMCYHGHVSDSVTVPERCIPLPAEVPDAEAVFAILGSIGLHGVRRGRVAIGEDILVLGLGVIGQISVKLLQLCGVRRVDAVDAVPFRRRLARQNGAAQVFSPAEIPSVPGGDEGYDVVIDATGNPGALPGALRAAAPRGRVVLLGCPHGEVAVDPYADLLTRDVELIGAYQPNCAEIRTTDSRWTQRGHRFLIVDFIRQKRLTFADLVTHEAAPEDAGAVYEALSRRKDAALCGLFRWQ